MYVWKQSDNFRNLHSVLQSVECINKYVTLFLWVSLKNLSAWIFRKFRQICKTLSLSKIKDFSALECVNSGAEVGKTGTNGSCTRQKHVWIRSLTCESSSIGSVLPQEQSWPCWQGVRNYSLTESVCFLSATPNHRKMIAIKSRRVVTMSLMF